MPGTVSFLTWHGSHITDDAKVLVAGYGWSLTLPRETALSSPLGRSPQWGGHVRRLCCSRALQTVQQRVPLVRTSVTRCSAARSMAPAGYDLLPTRIRSKCQTDQAKEQPSRVTDTNELRDEQPQRTEGKEGKSKWRVCVCIVRVNSHQPSFVTSVLCE